MASFSAQGIIAVHGTPLDTGDTAQRYPFNTRVFDINGAEWIYLKGITSLVKGDWVTFDEVGVTARLVANAVGDVGVAGAAIANGDFGWYQIYGNCTFATSGDVADAGLLYAHATAGSVDDVAVAGDRIQHAMAHSADDTSDTAVVGSISAWLGYPYTTNVAGDDTASSAP